MPVRTTDVREAEHRVEVGRRIRIRRHLADLTQRELANLINRPYQVVSMFETGQRMPRARDFEELSRVLGCSTDYLLSGRESATPIRASPKRTAR